MSYNCIPDSNVSDSVKWYNMRFYWHNSLLFSFSKQFFSHSMTNTKQTAKNSTSGKASRKQLAEKAAHLTSKAKTTVHPHRHRPETVALREIYMFQKSIELLVPNLPFQCVVREIAEDRNADVRFQAETINVLRPTTEEIPFELFEEAQRARFMRAG